MIRQVRVIFGETEAAALASACEMGRGDRNHTDFVAVEAMRATFEKLDIRGQSGIHVLFGTSGRAKDPPARPG